MIDVVRKMEGKWAQCHLGPKIKWLLKLEKRQLTECSALMFVILA